MTKEDIVQALQFLTEEELPDDMREKLWRILDRHDAKKRIAAYYKALEEEVNKKNPILRFYLTPEAVSAGIKPPTRAYTDDAGYDLRLLASEPLLIPPHERRPVPTGVGFEIPSGWYGLICNRTSGGKRGLVPLAQVVDASYTGGLTLTLHNTNDSETLSLEPGERVAQIVFMPTWAGSLSQIEPSEIKTTDRGSGAYGSSGKH